VHAPDIVGERTRWTGQHHRHRGAVFGIIADDGECDRQRIADERRADAYQDAVVGVESKSRRSVRGEAGTLVGMGLAEHGSSRTGDGAPASL